MDEIAALSQEIEFHEKFRGYDPDEVEAYVDRVRKTAAMAAGRITELHQRAEAAEALIAAGRVDSAEETLGRALLLAQQTADDLVAEATVEASRLTTAATERAAEVVHVAEEESSARVEQAGVEAEAILRDASKRSSRILAEAETDRREMVRRAESESEAAVAGLSKARQFLSDDIEILEGHVHEQRAKLSGIVSSLQDLVDDPQSFRIEPAPATSGVIVPSAEPSEPVEVEGEFEVEALLVEAEAPDLDVVSSAAMEGDPESLEVGQVIDLDRAEIFEPRPEGPAADTPEVDATPPSPPRLMTAADVEVEESVEVSVDPGPPTAPLPVVAGEPLFAEATSGEVSLFAAGASGLADGDLLATDSDALAAFFDQDDDNADRSWFGRRR